MRCLKCGNEMERKMASLPGEYAGERFNVKTEGMVCPACGYTTLHASQSDAYYTGIADAYRAKHRLLGSRQIRAARTQMGMTQQEFAKHLGVGIASLKRWELGKVQDRAMDQLIRLKTDYRFAEQNRQDVLLRQGGPEDEFSGWRRFSLERFQQVVLWFLESAKSVRRPLGPLQLNKLLWFSDVEHIKRFGVGITGLRYARLPYGPVPYDYVILYRVLRERGIVEYNDREIILPKASAEPTGLSAEEVQTLQRTWDKHQTHLDKLVQESHREKAWKETPLAQLISFKLVRETARAS